jgi:hypothetical protein
MVVTAPSSTRELFIRDSARLHDGLLERCVCSMAVEFELQLIIPIRHLIMPNRYFARNPVPGTILTSSLMVTN